MILWSKQVQTIFSCTISFQSNKITYVKTPSNQKLQQYKVHLRPGKFESFTDNSFKLLVLYMNIRTGAGPVGVMRAMNALSKEDIRLFHVFASEVSTYKFTTKADIEEMIKSSESAQTLYNKGKISLFGVYLSTPETRSQKIFHQKVDLFLQYLPGIKEYLDDFKHPQTQSLIKN